MSVSEEQSFFRHACYSVLRIERLLAFLVCDPVILCHCSCCAVIYRAFDIVLLHYSFLLLSLLSSLVVLTSMICLGKHCDSRETNHMQNVTSFHVISVQVTSRHFMSCHLFGVTTYRSRKVS